MSKKAAKATKTGKSTKPAKGSVDAIIAARGVSVEAVAEAVADHAAAVNAQPEQGDVPDESFDFQDVEWKPVQSGPPVVVTNSSLDAIMDSVHTTTNPFKETTKMTITLNKRGVEKSGNIAYAASGIRASVYFNKNMFAEGATIPEQLSVTVDSETNPFAQPGVAKAAKPKMTKEERIANLAAAREARKNETPAQKAERLQAKSVKLAEQAAKLAAAAQAAQSAPAAAPAS